MISATSIVVFLLGLGSFIFFRWFSNNAVFRPNQGRQTRLDRIRKASLLFQLTISISFLMAAYWVLAFVFGWPFFAQNQVRMVISQQHVYSAPAEMPPGIFAFWLVKTGLGVGCAAMLFALFGLYRQGILFAAKNVNCIRFLGYWLILDWLIDHQMQALLHDMALSTTPIFVGLLIIFVAWIMDEGRKIQEEQALTV